jgi:hypothetical protein
VQRCVESRLGAADRVEPFDERDARERTVAPRVERRELQRGDRSGNLGRTLAQLLARHAPTVDLPDRPLLAHEVRPDLAARVVEEVRARTDELQLELSVRGAFDAVRLDALRADVKRFAAPRRLDVRRVRLRSGRVADGRRHGGRRRRAADGGQSDEHDGHREDDVSIPHDVSPERPSRRFATRALP